MTELTQYSTEQRYRITLLVTVHQEFAIQGLFSLNGWAFSKVEEVPRLKGVDGATTVTECKNDSPESINERLSLPNNVQPVQLSKHTGIWTQPALTDQGVLSDQISGHLTRGNGSYTEIKKEIVDSETDSADEVNYETDTDEKIKSTVSTVNIAEKDSLNDKESISSDAVKSLRKTKKGKNKNAEKSKKVIEKSGAKKGCVNKFIYADGNAERKKVDNHIDEMSLIIRKDDTLVCCMCKVSFLDEDKFKDHAPVCLKNLFHLNESHVYKCRDCPAYFRHAYTFLRHRQYELCVPGQERKATILTCKHCKKNYSSKRRTQFIIHLQSHENDRPFECDQCDQKFTQWYTLKIHKRRHSDEKPYKCQHCDLRFISNAGKRNHEFTRHTYRPKSYVCDRCGAAFQTISNLKCHIKEVHVIPVLYTCEFCSKQFSRKSSLAQHHKAHANVRDKVCEVCGKAFFKQSYLTLHMKRHNNERSHFCDICGKGFYSNKNVIDHKRSHTGDKPYSCALCHYQCAYYSNTVKHIRHKHPEITDLKSVISKNDTSKAVGT